MNASKNEAEKRKNIGMEISKALEKIVSDKLGSLEEAFLLGNRLYDKSATAMAESEIQKKIMPDLRAETWIEKTGLEVGEYVAVRIELTNNGMSPILIARIDDAIPAGFELMKVSSGCRHVSNYLDARGLKIQPHITENIEIILRSTQTGVFIIAPKILCTSELGLQMTCRPEPATVAVRETILPNRIETGFQDLDNLLFGGFPENYAVVLTSESCDERDLLLRRFMETSLLENCLTFLVTIDPGNVRSLEDEFQNNFYALVCNPQGQETFENNPHIFKVNGVENLTELNITFESAFEALDSVNTRKGRVCLEIISDVLLQHRATQTRKWLSGLLPQLKSKGLTTLATLNPMMHSSEELHSIIGLFDGEVDIYSNTPKNGFEKQLRVKRLHNQRYLESEVPLKKTRLMTTPIKLSCCSRVPDI